MQQHKFMAASEAISSRIARAVAGSCGFLNIWACNFLLEQLNSDRKVSKPWPAIYQQQSSSYSASCGATAAEGGRKISKCNISKEKAAATTTGQQC